MISMVIEIVIVTFLIGAIVGGVVVAQLKKSGRGE